MLASWFIARKIVHFIENVLVSQCVFSANCIFFSPIHFSGGVFKKRVKKEWINLDNWSIYNHFNIPNSGVDTEKFGITFHVEIPIKVNIRPSFPPVNNFPKRVNLYYFITISIYTYLLEIYNVEYCSEIMIDKIINNIFSMGFFSNFIIF